MIVEKIISRLNKDHLNEDFFCELLDAVNSLVDGKAVENQITESIGCSVKWKQ